jgi:diadenosine tetraphosphate (Ap4A) HIT family hydrolase
VSDFALHPQLEDDTLAGAALDLSEARILNDSRWPWVVLVPRREGMRELHDLPSADRAALMEEIASVSRALAGLPGVAKVNVGALGNIVPQLHVHVIGRAPGDPAWPGPVWGVAGRVAYVAGEEAPLSAVLQGALRKT